MITYLFCLSQGNIIKIIKVPHTELKQYTHTHTMTQSHTHTMAQSHTQTHTHRHTHTHTHFMDMYNNTLYVSFKRRTATGIKEFLNLFVLQMGHLRRRPDGRVVNSWFKIWPFLVKIEQAFRKICCS